MSFETFEKSLQTLEPGTFSYVPNDVKSFTNDVETIPKEFRYYVSPWTDIFPNMFETFKKNSQGFKSNECDNKDILDFILKGNDSCSQDGIRDEFLKFPDFTTSIKHRLPRIG